MASEEAITEGVIAQDAIGDFVLKRLKIHVVTLDSQTFEGSTREIGPHTACALQMITLNRLNEGHNQR